MVRIITDSASDYRMGIGSGELTVLPMNISFDETSYEDRVDLSTEQFYEKLIENDTLPKTSQIPPYRFEEEYTKVVKAGDTAVVIVMSSLLSGTYANAVMAAEGYDGIYVVDSLNVTVGEYNLVAKAMELKKKGKAADEIAKELTKLRDRIKVLALLDTLEYLKKGGRISPSVAFVGGVLSIKPVVEIKDGEVLVIGKARGSKNGNNLLINMIRDCGGIDFNEPVCLGYSGISRAMADKYIEDSRAIWEDNRETLPVICIGPTIGTHVGPGVVAVSFVSKQVSAGEKTKDD